MSAPALIEMPPPPPGDILYEVVNGEIRELPPMGAFEVGLANLLVKLMDRFAGARDLGEAFIEMLFLLDATEALQRRPDVAFVSYKRWPKGKRIPRTAAWPVVPDLAAEVISSTNTWNEIVEKIADYFRTGVELVWVVSPVTKQVYVYTAPNANRILDRQDTLDGGEALPGFSLPLVELFREETD